jgi:hypothetical protein
VTVVELQITKHIIKGDRHADVVLWKASDWEWDGIAPTICDAVDAYFKTHPNRPDSARFTDQHDTYTATWENNQVWMQGDSWRSIETA